MYTYIYVCMHIYVDTYLYTLCISLHILLISLKMLTGSNTVLVIPFSIWETVSKWPPEFIMSVKYNYPQMPPWTYGSSFPWVSSKNGNTSPTPTPPMVTTSKGPQWLLLGFFQDVYRLWVWQKTFYCVYINIYKQLYISFSQFFCDCLYGMYLYVWYMHVCDSMYGLNEI